MKCPKCNSLMTFERFMGGARPGLPWAYEGWRCIHCGEILDPVIFINRMHANKSAAENWVPSEKAA